MFCLDVGMLWQWFGCRNFDLFFYVSFVDKFCISILKAFSDSGLDVMEEVLENE